MVLAQAELDQTCYMVSWAWAADYWAQVSLFATLPVTRIGMMHGTLIFASSHNGTSRIVAKVFLSASQVINNSKQKVIFIA